MDEDGIQLAMARASELRTKITKCIHNASAQQTVNKLQQGAEKENGYSDGIRSKGAEANGVSEEEDDEEGVDSLLNIRDALASLEGQLASLQELQQQQWYEKESALSEIELSRKKLLKKLKEYRGKDFQVIYEATCFASETVEVSNDLLLPPYPSRPPQSSSLSESHFPAQRKFGQNGIILSTAPSEEKIPSDCEAKKSFQGFRFFINATAKTMLMIVGLVSVLQLTGFEPRLRRRDAEFNLFRIFQNEESGGERKTVGECPPGKVLLVENGEMRCIVKERVEVPFEAVAVAKPDVSFGCG
ncbi:plastid division protein PDV2 [Impatiens glandulifera]|uniref:plastid division protein PDV2 n=1 Tax=Impatiens glandulifera TaxID=253017 RepID=UPI001FB16A77|nr:plastid division protein PDV2 [Impatiens glandulifera]